MNIEENSIYKSAETKPASSIAVSRPVVPDIEAVISYVESTAKNNPAAGPGLAIGKLFKNNIRENSSATEILSTIFSAYSELLIKELQYNNDNNKIEIIKNTLNNIQNNLTILKLLSYESHRDSMIYLLRSLVI